jgi:signal transduction histidine kinase
VLRSLSIRWRLALISAALTFVILCGFAAVVGELTSRRIHEDFNDQLQSAVDDLRRQIAIRVDEFGRVRGFGPNLDHYAGAEHAVVRVLTVGGAVIRQTKNAPDLGFAPGASVITTPKYRVAQREAPLSSGGSVVIQYARRISDVKATAARVRLFLILGVLGGTGLSLAAGLLLAGRAMRPISELTEISRTIARTRDPNQRVPIPDSEDEVAELARTLDEMLRALESSRAETEAMLARQRQFVADASHELRTPLTSVLANLELLVDVLDGERGEAARSALRSSQRMRRLVGDLLLLARADARRVAPHEPTDVAQVVVDAAAELGPVADGHELTIDAGGPAVVLGARDDLHRMILNLMENAVSHTPGGTRVRATVATRDGHVELAVEDDGPGVAPELRPGLFERFVRGTGDRGGSFGLGLAIVRAVAESHGGTVALESPREGTGARFVVRLPAAESREPAEPAPVLS